MADEQSGFLAGRNIPVLAISLVAGLSAVLAAVNTYMAYSNAQLSAEVRERQDVISQGIQLSPLNTQLSQLILELVNQFNDLDLRTILELHGITLSSAGAQPATGGAAPKP